MKHILLYAIAFVMVINCANAQWTQLNSPTTKTLNAVSFFNARLGYAVGANGTVLRTKDGGDSWSIMASPDTANLTSVVVIDSTVLLVTTGNTNGNSAVYKSTTSGSTWHKVLHDNLPFYATQTHDGKLFAMSVYLYSSNDGGETWKPEKRLNSTSAYTDIEFPDDATGYIGGNIRGQYTYNPEFLRSTDGGNKWHESYPFAFPDTSGFTCFNAMNADTIFMFTNYFKHFREKKNTELLLITRFHLKGTVGDTVWNFKAKVQIDSMEDVINDCKFFEGGSGYSAGNIGIIYHTTTYGKKWNKEYTGRTTIHGIYMQNENKGYAVGEYGLILRRQDTTAALRTSSTETMTVKVYPNPASNSSTVSFSLARSANVIVQLSNERGAIVYTQAKQYSAGSYQQLIPVANLQRGLYHITLIVNGKVEGRSQLLVAH